jgi:hypothetical protein
MTSTIKTSDFLGKPRGQSALAIKIAESKNLRANVDTKIVEETTKKFMQLLPSSNREVEFEMLLIDSKDINDVSYKSKYNRRSSSHLTKHSVIDLYGAIELEKMNTVPAYGCRNSDGKIEILAGLRRAYTVSLIPDSKLMILVATNLSEEEKMAVAFRSDEYKKPSNVDVAYSVLNYVKGSNEEAEKQSVKNGKSVKLGLSIDEALFDKLHAVFDRSRGYLNEHLLFAQYPDELYSLFPDVSYISYRFLRSLLAYREGDQIFNAISGIEPITVEDSDLSENIKAKTVLTQKAILKAISETEKKPVSVADTLMDFVNAEVKNGVKVTAGKSALTIKLDKKLMDDPNFKAEFLQLIKKQ